MRLALLAAGLGLAVASLSSLDLAGLSVSGLAQQHTQHRPQSGTHVSWRLSGTAPSSLSQSAAHLQVLRRKTTLVLDLVRETSASEAGTIRLTASELAALPASSTLDYRVRVRLNSTWSAWSAPAPWLVGPGPHAPADWPAGASWICVSTAGSTDLRSSILRSEFALPSGRSVASALVHVTGLGQYRLHVNGHDVTGEAGEFVTPGQTDWRKTVLYSTYDLAPSLLVAGGANAVAAQLGNGMYNVPSPSNGRYSKWVGSFGPRMLLLALVITLDDGSNVTVASAAGAGGKWLGTDGGPVSFAHEYAGEDFNESLRVPGFDLPAFDAAASNPLVAWSAVEDCSAAFAGGLLRPSSFEAVGFVDVLLALNMTSSSPPGTVLIDVGRNFAGTARLEVADVPQGHFLRVWPSETMYDGKIDQSSGGTPVFWQYFPNSSAPAPFSNVSLEPLFSMYGWRWLAVQVLSTSAAASPAVAGPNGTITVLSASYGLICDASLEGDETAAVAAFCDGKDPCPFWVCVCGDNTCPADAPPCLPDPSQNCAKDFSVTWRCTADAPGFNRSIYLPAEADNNVAALGCGAPPAPPPTPNVVSASGLFVRSAAKAVGSWTSSNKWVEAIFNITLEAIAANLQSVLTDCPHRERLGWLEVSHLMFPSIAYCFDISRLWAKIALDTVDSQLASGMVPDIAPEYTTFSGGFRDSPEWGSAAIQNPAWLLRWYGDAEIVNQTYAAGQRYVDYLLGQRDAQGLLSYGLGDWIPVVASPAGVTGTGILVQDLQAMASAATALGRPLDAANYTALAATVALAFERAFDPAGAGAYPTQCAAGLALALGFASNVAGAQRYLVGDVVSRGNVTTSGEIGNRYAFVALAEAAGGPEAVWASLLRADSPGYGWMLTMGETALSESWTDSRGDSHIHAMYGHVAEYLFVNVAGIQQAPGSTAWRRVRFAPRPPFAEGAGAWVEARFESPRGVIVSRVDIESAVAAVFTFMCPVAIECEARLPLSGRLVAVPATGTEHVVRDWAL